MGRNEAIPNRRLRRAVEYALGVAAELDGDQPVPDEVRRHRRRPLSAAAIGSLRRAIEADDGFRSAVAARLIAETGVAGGDTGIDDAGVGDAGVDDSGPGDAGDAGAGEAVIDESDVDDGPVDPIGSLWLLRPPGWRDAVDLLLELERLNSEIEAIDVARRREERRREAAEAHVARERTERDRVQRRLDAQSDQLVAASDRVGELERQLETARHELNEARMQARHSGDRERAARERLERLESELAGLEDAVRMGASADRSPADTGVSAGERDERDEREWRARMAAELTGRLRDVGDEFIERLVGEITDRLTSDPDGSDDRPDASPSTPSRPRAAGATADRIARATRSHERPDDPPTASGRGSSRRPRRRPLRMPPGVYSDSEAGVEYLLKSGARLIVDGYNVAKTAWPQLELVDQRERLIAMLESIAERHGIDVQVVFDGADVVGAATSRRRGIEIVFSPAGVLADEVIGQEVRRLPPDRAVVVVTDDRAVRDDTRSGGANIVASGALVDFGLR